MQGVTQGLTVAVKELREFLHRPWQILTLIFGPVILMVIFGLGSDPLAEPPRAIVVAPTEGGQSPLLDDYRQQFDEFLTVIEQTNDAEYAREQLSAGRVDAVVILPAEPYRQIAGGEQVQIQVLYDEIDPLWRGVVPTFVQTLAGQINHQLVVENVAAQQEALVESTTYLELLGEALDLAIVAAREGDRTEARRQTVEAAIRGDQLEGAVALLGPEAEPLRDAVAWLEQRLEDAEARMEANEGEGPAGAPLLEEQFGLVESAERVGQLREALNSFASLRPEVLIAPVTVNAQNTAQITPDIMTFSAPAVLALLVQHIGVSVGALALVRERLAETFDLYAIAPISTLQVIGGKYLAHTAFSLVVALAVVVGLRVALEVPLMGSAWRLFLTLVLLTLASVGLGFALSLLASSERQAVQFAMLALLAVVFFSGFAMPLDTLRGPALAVSRALPATYGVGLLRDIMLRGTGGSNAALLILAAIAAGLCLLCLQLLQWRMRAQ